MTLSHVMRMVSVVAAMVAGSGLAAVGFAGTASASVLANQPVGVAQCEPNTSQDCPQAPEVHFNVPGGVDVTAYFTANANHCSDINVRFVKDDPTTGWYPASEFQRVGPGQTVSSGIDVPSGAHTIKVFAQGIDGGCNTGHLDAWGGTLRIESTVRPTEAAPAPNPQQPPPADPGRLIPFPFPFDPAQTG